MSPVRIGFFLDSYKPYISGVVHSVDSFANELRRLGHEVYIVAPGAPGYRDDEFTIRASSFHTPLQPAQHYLPYPFLPALRRRVASLKLDIIHTHQMFLLGRLGAAHARRLDIPLVHTYHTLLTEYVHYVRIAPRLAKRSVVVLTRMYCNRCDNIVSPTPQVKDILLSYGVTKPIDAIPTGIDLTPYEALDKSECRKVLGYGDDVIVIAWLARLAKEKNPEFIIEAFARLHAERPHTRLMMMGGGIMESRLRQMVSEAGLERVVKLTGAIPHSDVPRYCTACDLFAYASLTETQAIVLPEAMAGGLPVVAVGANGVSGMVRDGEDGFLTPLDIEEFVRKLTIVVDDADLRRQLSRGALSSAVRLSSRESTAALVRLYERALANYK